MKTVLKHKKFDSWLLSLRDKNAVRRITARIDRLAAGLEGDVKPVGEGVSELRVHYGPGYRIYFQNRGGVLVLLLCGGNKKSQKRDIETAKELAKDWDI